MTKYFRYYAIIDGQKNIITPWCVTNKATLEDMDINAKTMNMLYYEWGVEYSENNNAN